jgi:xylulokinase
MNYFLGLDIGTSGTKSLLIDESGRKMASEIAEYPLSTPQPLWAEQNPQHWWDAVVATVRALIKSTGIDSGDIAAIGLSGQMHGSVFLDSANSVLRPAILWCDQRTGVQCEWLINAAGPENLSKYIANPILTGFTAPKIVWLRDNEPDNYAKVAHVLLPKDYIRLQLTGEFATEVSDASGTALFDVANRRWSQEMLYAAEIPPSWMPDCYESIVVSGTVSTLAAQLTGLRAGTPVVGGGGDQAAGAVGCGVVGTGVVSSTIGTSGVVFAFADQPAVDPDLRMHTFCHAVPGKWHIMGVQLSAGGSLRWLRDTLFPGSEYSSLTALAESVPAGSEGLIFLPYLAGERTPHPDPYARGAYVGLTLRHSQGHIVRSTLEGVSFGLRDQFEIFKELGVAVDQVRASGGGAKSRLWNQINADITGYEHVTLSVDEGPALGAALLAAVGSGRFATVEEACNAAVHVTGSTKPNLAQVDEYEKYYEVFRRLYPVLKPEFHALSAASQQAI